jgi:hypothetical protein
MIIIALIAGLFIGFLHGDVAMEGVVNILAWSVISFVVLMIVDYFADRLRL